MLSYGITLVHLNVMYNKTEIKDQYFKRFFHDFIYSLLNTIE
jgi:hypothetical protein